MQALEWILRPTSQHKWTHQECSRRS